MTVKPPKHPAKFSPEILAEIEDLLDDFGWPEVILDPFAGTGRIHRLTTSFTIGAELEPEWTAMERNNVVANTLHLPFPDACVDAIVTSPVYANRFSDSHNAQDGSHRRSYTHDLGRKLHPDNAGQLQWGKKYRAFHEAAWTECLRVLRPAATTGSLTNGGLFILNISNHYRNKTEQPVTEWHLNWFLDHDCVIEDFRRVATKRLKDGENRQRVPYEAVVAMRFVAPVLTPDELPDPLPLQEEHDDDDPRVDEPPVRSRVLDALDT